MTKNQAIKKIAKIIDSDKLKKVIEVVEKINDREPWENKFDCKQSRRKQCSYFQHCMECGVFIDKTMEESSVEE